MHKPALVSVLLLALASGVALAQTAAPAALQERIARVEQGLLLPVVVQGQSAAGMSLRDRMAYWRVPGVSIALINHGAV